MNDKLTQHWFWFLDFSRHFQSQLYCNLNVPWNFLEVSADFPIPTIWFPEGVTGNLKLDHFVITIKLEIMMQTTLPQALVTRTPNKTSSPGLHPSSNETKTDSSPIEYASVCISDFSCGVCGDVKVDVQLSSCGCTFITCKECFTRLVESSELISRVKCPGCRALISRDPKVDGRLKMLISSFKSVAACGQAVFLGEMSSHAEDCLKCLRQVLQTAREENKHLSKSNTTLGKRSRDLEMENHMLRNQLELYEPPARQTRLNEDRQTRGARRNLTRELSFQTEVPETPRVGSSVRRRNPIVIDTDLDSESDYPGF